MKNDKYDDLLEEISEQLANKILKEEDNLAKRARTLDKDILDKLQTVGKKATKKVLEKTRDELVEKKSPKD